MPKSIMIINSNPEAAQKIAVTSRTYKAIKDELSTVISELRRIEAGQNVDVDLLDLLSRITSAIDTLKEA